MPSTWVTHPNTRWGGGRELTQGLHPCRGQHRGGSSFLELNKQFINSMVKAERQGASFRNMPSVPRRSLWNFSGQRGGCSGCNALGVPRCSCGLQTPTSGAKSQSGGCRHGPESATNLFFRVQLRGRHSQPIRLSSCLPQFPAASRPRHDL